ncbi:hypothetical protein OF83DRAFT_1086549 [Amylostereum chailletii]|nr:hypothetical protein OF83DRAFT_1086549 [Amylostereum chailletii]
MGGGFLMNIHPNIPNAHISATYPLRDGNFVVVLCPRPQTDAPQVLLEQVITMYTQSARGGRHMQMASIDSAGTPSYVNVQVFSNLFNNTFQLLACPSLVMATFNVIGGSRPITYLTMSTFATNISHSLERRKNNLAKAVKELVWLEKGQNSKGDLEEMAQDDSTKCIVPNNFLAVTRHLPLVTFKHAHLLACDFGCLAVPHVAVRMAFSEFHVACLQQATVLASALNMEAAHDIQVQVLNVYRIMLGFHAVHHPLSWSTAGTCCPFFRAFSYTLFCSPSSTNNVWFWDREPRGECARNIPPGIHFRTKEKTLVEPDSVQELAAKEDFPFTWVG